MVRLVSHSPENPNALRAGWYEREGQAQWWDGSSWHEGDWQVPAGWYEVAGSTRWWDGSAWTDHQPQQPAQPEPSLPARVLGVPVWTATLIAGGFVVAGFFGLLTLNHLFGSDDSSTSASTFTTYVEPEPAESFQRAATVEDIVAATCTVGAFNEAQSACSDPLYGNGVIFYGVEASQFQAENKVAQRYGVNTEYVITSLEGGEYLVVTAQDAGVLSPLETDFGLLIQKSNTAL